MEIYVRTVTIIIEKKHNNTLSEDDIIKKNRKVVDFVKNNNNRTFIIGFPNCGKTYLKNHILHQKQKPIFINTKSINQYPNIKTQADEIQPLETYECSIVVFDNMLLSNKKAILICFLIEVDIKTLIYTAYLKTIFTSPKILFVLLLI